MTRHFISLLDLSPEELLALLDRAEEIKAEIKSGQTSLAMQGKTLALLFDKSSTRTRVSFETGMNQMGGSTLFLSPVDAQIGRGEPIEDTARVISSMVDIVAIRTGLHGNIIRFAEFSSVPVINALTDFNHPCQLLADMQTFKEHRGDIAGKSVAWVGDGNNMCNSYINAAAVFDFELRIACPEGYEPDADLIAKHSNRVSISQDPTSTVRNTDLVVTDVWASMGQEQEQQQRQALFAAFQVNQELMSNANSDALFMHCLPAHRGEEVSADLLDSDTSVVWDEAENRMHSQKALLEFLCSQ